MPEKDDYSFLLRGAKISKREAKEAGLGIFFGTIGIFVAIFTPLSKMKLLAYGVIAAFSLIGYYLGVKLFRRK